MTDEASRGARAARWLPLASGIALALPTLVATYPPMNDLPLHEGVVGALRHFGDASYFPNGLYVLNLGHPNQLFYLLAVGLSFVVSTAMACKLVIAAAQIATMTGAAKLASHLGRSPYGALLVAPLALGFTYYWGLVPNLLGFPALLYALPIVDDAAQKPTGRAILASSALVALTYFAHESVCVALLGVVVLFAACHPLERRATSMRLFPAAFGIVLVGAQLAWQRRFFTRAASGDANARFLPLLQKIEAIPNVLFGAHDLPSQLMLFVLACIALGLLVAQRIRDDTPPEIAHEAAGRFRTALHRYRFELVAMGFLLGYLVMPFSWRYAKLIHERFFSPGWALLVICATPKRAPSLLGKIAASVLPAAILLLAWPQFADASRTARDLEELLARIPKGSAVASLSWKTRTDQTRVFSPSAAPGRSLSLVGGRAGLSLGLSPISPVLVAEPYRWDDYESRTLLGGARGFVPSHDLARFGFLVVQTNEAAAVRVLVHALEPDASLVAARGEWSLFRSKHELVPLTTEAGPPDPPAETLAMRIVTLTRASH